MARVGDEGGFLEALRAEGVPTSIDTWTPAVARAAARSGVALLNDVTGLTDPEVEVLTGTEITEESQSAIEQELGFITIFLSVFALISLFVGSFIIGFIYTFGTALLPDLAYVILFLPMIVVIAPRAACKLVPFRTDSLP